MSQKNHIQSKTPLQLGHLGLLSRVNVFCNSALNVVLTYWNVINLLECYFL